MKKTLEELNIPPNLFDYYLASYMNSRKQFILPDISKHIISFPMIWSSSFDFSELPLSSLAIKTYWEKANAELKINNGK